MAECQAREKQIQKLMGHSSTKVTLDTYGHLFVDNEADQRAAEGVEFAAPRREWVRRWYTVRLSE